MYLFHKCSVRTFEPKIFRDIMTNKFSPKIIKHKNKRVENAKPTKVTIIHLDEFSVYFKFDDNKIAPKNVEKIAETKNIVFLVYNSGRVGSSKTYSTFSSSSFSTSSAT